MSLSENSVPKKISHIIQQQKNIHSPYISLLFRCHQWGLTASPSSPSSPWALQLWIQPTACSSMTSPGRARIIPQILKGDRRIDLLGLNQYHMLGKYIRDYPLVMTNIAMVQMADWKMAHRNRWFTELKNGGSFHGYVSHNQRGNGIMEIYKGFIYFWGDQGNMMNYF